MTEESLRFIIPVCPMSLQASGKQMIIRNGRPIFFKLKKAVDYQKIIRLYASKYRPAKPWECPIHLQVDYYLDRPMRLNTKKIASCAQYCPKRPDLDNLQKGTQDAFKGFWLDDSQIAQLTLRKFYAPLGKEAWIDIQMNKLPSFLNE